LGFWARTGDGARICRRALVVVFEATSNGADGAMRDLPVRRRSSAAEPSRCRIIPPAASRRSRPARRRWPCRDASWQGWGGKVPILRELGSGKGCPSAAASNPYPAAAATGAPPRPQAGRLLSPHPRRPAESTSKPGQPINRNERWTEKLRTTGRAARGQTDHAPVKRLVARASAPGNTRQPEQLGYLRDCMRRYTIRAGRGISHSVGSSSRGGVRWTRADYGR
jgi:hypothetical protein